MKYFTQKLRTLISAALKQELEQVNEQCKSRMDASDSLQQKQLFIQMRSAGLALNEVGFSVFSESDEDGLLLFLFAKMGLGKRLCVDIGGGRGLEGSNTANLILHHGFSGLIIEGEAKNVEALKQVYAFKQATKHAPPKIIQSFVTVENINQLIQANGITGEVDLLSIDIDSIDYWIWDAITVIEPRVVIVEIQCILDAAESKSVPPDFKETVFETVDNRRYGIYNSASLLAFTNLANRKGYRLVATNHLGFNAIFVKSELVADSVPTISVSEGLNKPFVKWAQQTFGKRSKELPWITV